MIDQKNKMFISKIEKNKLKLKELIHAIQLYLEELLANSFQIV
jgi:hypothetical protein